MMPKFETLRTREPDFTGSHFYVKYGREFDEESYEIACGVKPPREVCRQIQKDVDDLRNDEWLLERCEVVEIDEKDQEFFNHWRSALIY